MEHKGTKSLETKRLLLRKITVGDTEAAFANWMSDGNVTTYLRWPTHTSIETSRAVIASWVSQYAQADFYQWVIVLKETGAPVGTIGTIGQDDDLERLEIGYCLGSRWWHQGIMSEALAAVIHYLFTEVGANRIDARHDPHNPHSGAVMKKCGLRYEGTLRQADRNNQGIVDVCLYAILREDCDK